MGLTRLARFHRSRSAPTAMTTTTPPFSAPPAFSRPGPVETRPAPTRARRPGAPSEGRFGRGGSSSARLPRRRERASKFANRAWGGLFLTHRWDRGRLGQPPQTRASAPPVSSRILGVSPLAPHYFRLGSGARPRSRQKTKEEGTRFPVLSWGLERCHRPPSKEGGCEV